LDLSSNFISKVEGLTDLKLLKNLGLGSNHLESLEACSELLELPELAHLDLSGN